MNQEIALEKIIAYQRAFVAERDWDKFHTPKNLAMALSGEAGELVELFQWLSAEESYQIAKDEKKAQALRSEIADIFWYLTRLCDKLDIDLEKSFWEKTKSNEAKYPVSLAKGTATKYTDF